MLIERGNVMKRSVGFTLVEMMITVAILAILAAIAIPSFSTFIRSAQIRTAAESMQAGLNLARAESLRRNARVSLWMVTNLTAGCVRSGSGTSWVVSMADPAAKCNVAASETVAPRLVQSRSGSEGTAAVSLSATGGGAASSCITFNGFGQVEAACTGGGTPIDKIVFSPAVTTSGAKVLEVRVTSGGAIRMCRQGASSDDPAYCGV